MSVSTQPAPPSVVHAPANVKSSSHLLDDRRCTNRQQRLISVVVRPIELAEPQSCDVRDLSEGGMLVHVPLSYGLNVGQRCEVRFSGSGATMASQEAHYATVVRTEVTTEGDRRLLGAGLRFDQPLYL